MVLWGMLMARALTGTYSQVELADVIDRRFCRLCKGIIALHLNASNYDLVLRN